MFKDMNVVNYTPATLAILDTLGESSDSSFHTRKIAEEAGVSVGAASTILRELERQNLAVSEVKGNMKFYRIDLLNPVAREFKVLFNIIKLKPLVDPLKEIADRVTLFGSCAEGLDGKDSDVDLFILAQDARPVNEEVARFEKQFEKQFHRHLSPIIVDAEGQARMRRQDSPLFNEIARGRVLWPKE